MNLEDKALQFAPNCLLGVHSSVEGVWGHGHKGIPFFL